MRNFSTLLTIFAIVIIMWSFLAINSWTKSPQYDITGICLSEASDCRFCTSHGIMWRVYQSEVDTLIRTTVSCDLSNWSIEGTFPEFLWVTYCKPPPAFNLLDSFRQGNFSLFFPDSFLPCQNPHSFSLPICVRVFHCGFRSSDGNLISSAFCIQQAI